MTVKLVIRASVPKLTLDDAFEQKNNIAKAVEDELEKVDYLIDSRYHNIKGCMRKL